MKNEQGNLGAWYRKNNWKDFYINFEPDVIPEGCTRTKPLDDAEYQKFDEETGQWVADPEAEKQAQITEIYSRFDEIDRLDGPRPIREAVAQLASSAGLDTSYLIRHEAEAQKLRDRLTALSA